VHITIGDAGNAEGLYREFVDLQDTPLPVCTNPTAPNNTRKLFSPTYQPQACYSYQDGAFCPSTQPAWSAFREPSFGFGVLEVESASRATWRWHTNQGDPTGVAADEVVIERSSEPSSSDPRQGCQPAPAAAPPPDAYSGDAHGSDLAGVAAAV
jgi:hypothetical protein